MVHFKRPNMRKKLITFLFLIVTLNTFGQDKQDAIEKKWAIGILTMPTILTNFETSKEIDLTLLTGLKIEKNISNSLTLSSGLNYIQTNLYHGAWHGAPCDNPMATCYIYSKTDFIEVPLTLKIYYLKEKQKVNNI